MSQYTESVTTWLEPETKKYLEEIAEALEQKKSSLIRRYLKEGLGRDIDKLKVEKLDADQQEIEGVLE